MPIVVMEGPDCCGKTTVFDCLRQNLQGPTYVPKTFMPEGGCYHSYAAGMLASWEVLFIPGKLYICDRHVLTSEPMYFPSRGRKPFPMSWLLDYLTPYYLQVPYQELCRRHSQRGEEVPSDFPEIYRRYESAAIQRGWTLFDGTLPAGELVNCIDLAVRRLM